MRKDQHNATLYACCSRDTHYKRDIIHCLCSINFIVAARLNSTSKHIQQAAPQVSSGRTRAALQQDGVGRSHTSTYHEGPQNTSAQEGDVVVDIRRIASPQRVTTYRPRSGCYITRGHVKSNIDGAEDQGLQHKGQLTGSTTSSSTR